MTPLARAFRTMTRLRLEPPFYSPDVVREVVPDDVATDGETVSSEVLSSSDAWEALTEALRRSIEREWQSNEAPSPR